MKKKIVILFLAATLAVSGLFAGCGKNEKGGNSSTSEISADSENVILYTPIERKASDFMPISWMSDYEGLVTDCDYEHLDPSDPRYQADYTDDTGIAGIIQMLEEKTTYADLTDIINTEYENMMTGHKTAAQSQGKEFTTYLEENYNMTEVEFEEQARKEIEQNIKQNALAMWLVEKMDITVSADNARRYAELAMTPDENDDSSATTESTQSVEEFLGSLSKDGSLDYFYFLCASEEALNQIRNIYNADTNNADKSVEKEEENTEVSAEDVENPENTNVTDGKTEGIGENPEVAAN